MKDVYSVHLYVNTVMGEIWECTLHNVKYKNFQENIPGIIYGINCQYNREFLKR